MEISKDKPLYYFARVGCSKVTQAIYAQREGEEITINFIFNYPTHKGGGIAAKCSVVDFDSMFEQAIEALSIVSGQFDKINGGTGEVEVIREDMRKLTFKEQIKFLMKSGIFNVYMGQSPKESLKKYKLKTTASEKEKNIFLNKIENDFIMVVE